MNRGFPKTMRLRRRSEFRRVYETGAPQRNAGFHLFVRPCGEGAAHPTRLGITVTKRAGGAVVRNRLRRWAREYFRHARPGLQPGFEAVLNIHPRMAKTNHDDFDRLLADVFSKAHLFKS